MNDLLDWDDRNAPGALAALSILLNPEGYDSTGAFEQVLGYIRGLRDRMAIADALLTEHDAYVLRVTNHGARSETSIHELRHSEADALVRQMRRAADDERRR